ncbi:MAG TPA: iron-containing redox enzyme family protein [Thermoanaerobaculia bacterium]
MPFTEELHDRVLRHGAVNNAYLDRFQQGSLSPPEFERFAVQFFAFVKSFPRILATLLANTPDDAAADELATILVSELGDGNPKRRHEYLYHRFLRSIGLDPVEAGRRRWLPSTRAYIEGLADLYGDREYARALGASFGLEHMAIPMWDQLIPGLQALREHNPNLAGMDLFYWTFHRDLEQGHEDAMNRTLNGLTSAEERLLTEGCHAALDLLEGFWMGLDRPTSSENPVF